MQKKIIILSGEVMERSDLGRFVIDVDSIKTHKDRLIADYNHEESEVIGYVENIHSEDGKLIGDLVLESTTPNDRAAEVIARIDAGTPYEISPTVMLDEAGVEVEIANEGKGKNQYFIYRNVPLRGVSVCPYGTDRLTTILSLTGGKIEMKKVKKMTRTRTRNPRKLTRMAADEILEDAIVESQVVDEAATDEVTEEAVENEYTAYPLLEQFIQLFGFELGVEYFRRGYTLEEAEAADYAQLKAARLKAAKLAAEEEIDEAGAIDQVADVDDNLDGAEEEAEIVEEAQEAIEDAVDDLQDPTTLKQAKTTLKANIVLAKAVRSLAKEVTKLKAIQVRGTDAIGTNQRKAVPMTALQKMARKIHNR